MKNSRIIETNTDIQARLCNLDVCKNKFQILKKVVSNDFLILYWFNESPMDQHLSKIYLDTYPLNTIGLEGGIDKTNGEKLLRFFACQKASCLLLVSWCDVSFGIFGKYLDHNH